MVWNKNKNKIDVFNMISIISIIFFVIVLVINGIFVIIGQNTSGDPYGAGQEFGWYWILIGFIPSVISLFGSVIMAIIAVIAYVIRIIKKEKINTKKTILVIINIIQIILVTNVLIQWL